MVEVDVRRCAGRELVLSHDPSMGGHVVADTGWEVLSRLDLGGGQRPLLLEEALAAFPDRAFNLEVKNDPAEPGFEDDAAIAVETAERSRPGDLLSSFWWPAMDAVRAAHPGVATGLLVDRGWDLAEAIDRAREGGHRALIPHWSVVLEAAPGVLATAGGTDLMVVCWTVNDAEVAIRLAEQGVAAIITDDPGGMRAALEG
jgi:glycerophosphoryl diester phosphodiesterase